MPPLSFSDEEMNAITALASALPRHVRAEFLQHIAAKLSEHPVRGVGLVYRLAVEVQRDLLRGGLVAVGVSAKSGKYGRAQSLRQGRRR